jgi:hypothetical protein
LLRLDGERRRRATSLRTTTGGGLNDPTLDRLIDRRTGNLSIRIAGVRVGSGHNWGSLQGFSQIADNRFSAV